MVFIFPIILAALGPILSAVGSAATAAGGAIGAGAGAAGSAIGGAAGGLGSAIGSGLGSLGSALGIGGGTGGAAAGGGGAASAAGAAGGAGPAALGAGAGGGLGAGTGGGALGAGAGGGLGGGAAGGSVAPTAAGAIGPGTQVASLGGGLPTLPSGASGALPSGASLAGPQSSLEALLGTMGPQTGLSGGGAPGAAPAAAPSAAPAAAPVTVPGGGAVGTPIVETGALQSVSGSPTFMQQLGQYAGQAGQFAASPEGQLLLGGAATGISKAAEPKGGAPPPMVVDKTGRQRPAQVQPTQQMLSYMELLERIKARTRTTRGIARI